MLDRLTKMVPAVFQELKDKVVVIMLLLLKSCLCMRFAVAFSGVELCCLSGSEGSELGCVAKILHS